MGVALILRHRFGEGLMLSKCANPGCTAKLHYLRDGRIYRIGSEPARNPTQPDVVIASEFRREQSHPIQNAVLREIPKPPQIVIPRSTTQRQEYFWLCRSCSEEMTVALHDNAVVVVPIRKKTAYRAVAS